MRGFSSSRIGLLSGSEVQTESQLAFATHSQPDKLTKALGQSLCWLSLMLFAFSLSAYAQTSKGFIVGTITDPNSASVVGATVKISNTATGVSRQTVSQSDGRYRFDAVDPGSYKIEVNAAGFKSATRDALVVTAAQTADVAFQLEVGNPSEFITVTSEAPVELQTQDGARISTLDKRQITDLPLLSLNPTNLVYTLPGVSETSRTQSGGFVQGNEFSINGVRARGNNELIDGLDNNDNSITGQFFLPILRDAYQEVTVLGSDYSAEYGRAGGAVVNVITRSGSNQFHGSGYDIISPSKLFSLTPGQKSTNGLTKVPHSIENLFGFSLGGPIKKNKLFFFGSFQPDLVRSNTVATAIVPTQDGINTLRSLFPMGRSPNLDRYLSIIGNTVAPTATQLIPLGGGRPSIPFGNATVFSTQPVNDYQFLGRVDWTPNAKDNFAFRYTGDKQRFNNQFPTSASGGSPFPGFEIDVPSLVQNFLASYTRNMSARTTNEFRFGYGRFNLNFASRNKALESSGPQFTFTGTGSGSPAITAVGLTPGFPQGRIFNNYQFQDTISHTIGKHTLRIGADVLVQRANELIPIVNRGILTFASSRASSGVAAFPAFGNFIDQFSGTGSGGVSSQVGPGTAQPNTTNQAYFINDTWQARSNLTLMLGLRYELYGTPANAAPFPGFQPNFFDPTQPFPVRVVQKRDWNNFAPRASFAYTPRFQSGPLRWLLGDNRSVFRGGFAVGYDVLFNNIVNNIISASPSTFGVSNLGASVGGRGIANFTPSPAILPTGGAPSKTAAENPIEANLLNPVEYIWSFGLQRELPGKVILDTAYVGSRGLHQFINVEENPGIGGFGTLTRGNPAFGSVLARTNAGDSNYHSLQARLERGFRRGLLFRFAYTYSKAIDDVNSEVFTTSGGSTRQSDPLSLHGGFRADRSVATFDTPQRFVSSVLYDIPSLAKSGFAHALLSHYTLSGTYRWQSGSVETPFVGGIDLNGDGSGFNDRPAISNPNAPPTSVAFLASLFGDTSPTGYEDINGNPISLTNARYVVDPNIHTGIAGRNTLRGPAFNRLDVSMFRAIKVPSWLGENSRFEIRMEFFNVLNHPYFAWDHNNSDGNVLGLFNQPRLNDGGMFAGSNRIGRIQLRLVF